MTIQDRLAADLAAIYIGNLNTVEADLTLPSAGDNGSTFTWSTSDPRFIDENGSVHQPLHGMGNRKVWLTVTATLEGECSSRVMEAMVIQKARATIVTSIRPVAIHITPGQEVHLPSVVIVRCQDGRQITMPVTWDPIPAKALEVGHSMEVNGHLEATQMLAQAIITVCESKVQPDAPAKRIMKYVPMSQIRLARGSIFQEYQQRMVEYLLNQDDDTMLYNFRRACGLDTCGAQPMTGWDTPEGMLRGHTTGHYLSGLALAWAATGEERLLEKIRYMLESLREVQEAFAASGKVKPGFFSAYDEEQFDLLEVYTRYPEIWAPYYTLDKIMSGLYDIYQATGLELAFRLERDLGDWVYNRLSRLPREQLNRMWAMYIAGEFGGMLGTMVKLYELTGDEKHLAAARLFYNEKLFYPMAENCDTLEDMHGNQHIPQAIGAADMFRATGDAHYWQIGRNFWEIVTGHHIYVNGGVGETEMFHGPDTSSQYLSEKSEESCASYNMLRLTGEVFAYDPDPRMLDYYDNTLRNHLMTSCCHDSTGGTTYFLPLQPGGQKFYSTDENTCCHGTGMESRFRYMEHMYGEDESFHYVNLLIDSTVDTQELKLTLAVGEDETVKIQVRQDLKKGLRVHIPGWAKDDFTYELANASGLTAEITDGWLSIDGPIPADTQVTLNLPMKIRILSHPSDGSLTNIAYGPTLLAALSEQTHFLETPENLRREGNTFTNGTVKMIPLNRVDLEHYHVYFRRHG